MSRRAYIKRGKLLRSYLPTTIAPGSGGREVFRSGVTVNGQSRNLREYHSWQGLYPEDAQKYFSRFIRLHDQQCSGRRSRRTPYLSDNRVFGCMEKAALRPIHPAMQETVSRWRAAGGPLGTIESISRGLSGTGRVYDEIIDNGQ